MPANIFSNRWGSSQKCRHEEQVGTPERPLLANRFMSHHPVRLLAIAVPGGPRTGHRKVPATEPAPTMWSA